jgi:hypothetical protein
VAVLLDPSDPEETKNCMDLAGHTLIVSFFIDLRCHGVAGSCEAWSVLLLSLFRQSRSPFSLLGIMAY